MDSPNRSNSQSQRLSRRTLLKLSSATAGAMTLAQLLSACTVDSGGATTSAGDGAAQSAPAAESGDPQTGGELIIGSIQEPDSLNPWLTGLTVGMEVESMIYESLTRVDPAGNHVPTLAAEVPSPENGGKFKSRLAEINSLSIRISSSLVNFGCSFVPRPTINRSKSL